MEGKYSIFDIAGWFLEKEPMPHKRLQKLCYYALAWLHHKGRNKHHWEFWVDMTRNGVTAAKMPNRYILEMFCDRVAASMIYNGDCYTDRDALSYYEGGKHSYIMHPKTREILEELLYYLADHGLDETIRYINEEKDLRNDD